jgi:hypothetical protein
VFCEDRWNPYQEARPLQNSRRNACYECIERALPPVDKKQKRYQGDPGEEMLIKIREGGKEQKTRKARQDPIQPG